MNEAVVNLSHYVLYINTMQNLENGKYISLTGYNSMQRMAICFLLS